jgi:hypothetical protein
MKVCRQEGCDREVDRPRKRVDCDECFNRLRREVYASNKDYREKIKTRNIKRNRTNLGRRSRMLSDARGRAARKGLEFNIELEDILVPSTCPYLGILLVTDNPCKRDDSPTLDRVVPSLGYVKGNVEVISERANRIKNDATPEELLLIATRYNIIVKGSI